jgi:hypothetical protein
MGQMSTGQSRHSGGRVTGHRRLCFHLPPARCARHVGPQRRRGRKDGVMVAEPKVRIAWSPRGNPAQMRLLKCQVLEIFFGGARGGGKTDGVLGEFGAHASRYGKDAIGLMVRRTRAELVETIERSREIYGPLGWKLNDTEKMWRAPDGARLRFAYLERDADADMYQGHNYTRVYVEEVGNFPSPAPVMKLMATLRSGAGVPVGLRATGNPGGPGHQWVKARYIDPAPLGNKIIRDEVSGLERVFIPSKVDNNRYIDVEAYKQRLRASGSKELVRAWLDGDWSVAMGAFFDCWDTKRHVIEPFEVPKDWMRFRSMDWGSASPFSVGWWALVQDDFAVHGRVLPRGCMVRYREWYGMRRGEPNVGLNAAMKTRSHFTFPIGSWTDLSRLMALRMNGSRQPGRLWTRGGHECPLNLFSPYGVATTCVRHP